MNEAIASSVALLQNWDIRKAQTCNPTFPSPLFCRPSTYPNLPVVWNAMLGDPTARDTHNALPLPLDWLSRSADVTRSLAAKLSSVALPSWPTERDEDITMDQHQDRHEDPDPEGDLFPRRWRAFMRRLGQGAQPPAPDGQDAAHTFIFSREVNDWLCALSYNSSRLTRAEVDQMLRAFLQRQLAALVRERVTATCPGRLYLLADAEDDCADDSALAPEDRLTLTELATPLKEIRGLLGSGLGSHSWTLSSVGGAYGSEMVMGWGSGSGLGKRPRDAVPASAVNKGQKLFAEPEDEDPSPGPLEGRQPDLAERDSILLRLASDSKRGRHGPPSSLPVVRSPRKGGPAAAASPEQLQLRGAISQELRQEKQLERFLAEALQAGQLATLNLTYPAVAQDEDKDQAEDEDEEMRRDPLRYIERCRQERIAFEKKMQ